MQSHEPTSPTAELPDAQLCMQCPMCHTPINAESIAGVCASCPLYHMKNGCCIDLIACPECGYHSLPQEHAHPTTGQVHPTDEQAQGPHAAPAPQGDNGGTAHLLATWDGSAAPCSGAVRLSEVRTGTEVRLLGFSDIDDNHLGRLTAYGLLPGVNIEVLQRFPAIILGVYQAELALETKLAEGIWVLPS